MATVQDLIKKQLGSEKSVYEVLRHADKAVNAETDPELAAWAEQHLHGLTQKMRETNIYSMRDLFRMAIVKPTELKRKWHVADKEIDNVLKVSALCTFSTLRPRTASDLVSHTCTTGDEALDELLNGGIVSGHITELAGHSGAGKTQWCLQLVLAAQLKQAQGGLGGKVLYLNAEGEFPRKRYQQLVDVWHDRYPQNYSNIRGWMDNLLIEVTYTIEDLADIIRSRLRNLLRYRSVKLIILDSIAALCRTEFDSFDAPQRAELLFSLTSTLKELAEEFDVAIVIVNQVSAVIMDGLRPLSSTYEFDRSSSILPNLSPVVDAVPSLGLAWAHCVTTRLFLQRTPSRRIAHVVFSPNVPTADLQSVEYAIDADGVHGITD